MYHDHHAGTHFINFSITIQMWWKFHFALIQIIMKWSLQNFAHGTTAVLSWHMQHFVAIGFPAIELQLNKIYIEFELWWKNRQWNGSQYRNRRNVAGASVLVTSVLVQSSSSHSNVSKTVFSGILIFIIKVRRSSYLDNGNPYIGYRRNLIVRRPTGVLHEARFILSQYTRIIQFKNIFFSFKYLLSVMLDSTWSGINEVNHKESTIALRKRTHQYQRNQRNGHDLSRA